MKHHFPTQLSGVFLLSVLITGVGLTLSGCQTRQQEVSGEQVAAPAPENYRDFQDADGLASYLHSPPAPLIGAHRGGPAQGFPENATQTFGHALTKGPVLLECDVRMTKDSVLVLMHDETLGRTTTGSGPVRGHALKEVRSVQLQTEGGSTTRFEVPTVQEALAWAEGRAILELDIKEEVPRSRVVEALRRSDGLDQALVITYIPYPTPGGITSVSRGLSCLCRRRLEKRLKRLFSRLTRRGFWGGSGSVRWQADPPRYFRRTACPWPWAHLVISTGKPANKGCPCITASSTRA